MAFVALVGLRRDRGPRAQREWAQSPRSGAGLPSNHSTTIVSALRALIRPGLSRLTDIIVVDDAHRTIPTRKAIGVVGRHTKMFARS